MSLVHRTSRSRGLRVAASKPDVYELGQNRRERRSFEVMPLSDATK